MGRVDSKENIANTILKIVGPINLVFVAITSIIGCFLSAIFGSNILKLIFSPVPSMIGFLICSFPAVLNGNWDENKWAQLNSIAFLFLIHGDIIMALEYLADVFFLLAMGFYLMGHIFFIIAFSFEKVPWNISRLFPILAFTTIILTYVLINCNSMMAIVVVVICALVDMTMCWRAIARIGFNLKEENNHSQWMVAVSSILFITSDLLLFSYRYCPHTFFETFQIIYLIFYLSGVMMMAIGSNRNLHPIEVVRLLTTSTTTETSEQPYGLVGSILNSSWKEVETVSDN